MNTKARLKANAKYDAKMTIQIHLKLNKKNDKDIIDKLNSVDKKQTYIKELIRQDIKANN